MSCAHSAVNKGIFLDRRWPRSLCKVLPALRRFVARHNPPLIAKVTKGVALSPGWHRQERVVVHRYKGGLQCCGVALGWIMVVCLLCGFDFPAVPQPALPFQEGEELTFEVHWLGLPVGTAVLSIGQPMRVHGHEVLPLVSLAYSAPFFATFYEVDDRVESHFDPRKLMPRFYRMRLKEGLYRSYREVTFDQERHHATYSKNRRPPQTSPTAAAVQDPLSSLYMVRTLPLKVGESVYLPIFDRGKTCLTEIQVLSRERLRLAIGEVSTLKLKPLLQTAGIFNRAGELFVWLTDDERRVPVQMHSSIAIGAITARLMHVRGVAWRQ